MSEINVKVNAIKSITADVRANPIPPYQQILKQIDNLDEGQKKQAETIKKALEEAKRYTDSELAEFDFIKIVSELPEQGFSNRFYLVPKKNEDTTENDFFDEYLWVNAGSADSPDYKWEYQGTKQIKFDTSIFLRFNEEQNLTDEEKGIARRNIAAQEKPLEVVFSAIEDSMGGLARFTCSHGLEEICAHKDNVIFSLQIFETTRENPTFIKNGVPIYYPNNKTDSSGSSEKYPYEVTVSFLCNYLLIVFELNATAPNTFRIYDLNNENAVDKLTTLLIEERSVRAAKDLELQNKIETMAVDVAITDDGAGNVTIDAVSGGEGGQPNESIKKYVDEQVESLKNNTMNLNSPQVVKGIKRFVGEAKVGTEDTYTSLLENAIRFVDSTGFFQLDKTAIRTRKKDGETKDIYWENLETAESVNSKVSSVVGTATKNAQSVVYSFATKSWITHKWLETDEIFTATEQGLYVLISTDKDGAHADATLSDGTKAGETFRIGVLVVPDLVDQSYAQSRSFFGGMTKSVLSTSAITAVGTTSMKPTSGGRFEVWSLKIPKVQS